MLELLTTPAALGLAALLLLVALVALGRMRPRTCGLRAPGPARSRATPADAPSTDAPTADAPVGGPSAPPATPAPAPAGPPRFLDRLVRTRTAIAGALAEAFGRGLTDEAWERLEEALLGADVGIEATRALVDEVRERARREDARDLDAVRSLLAAALVERLDGRERALARRPAGTTVWLVTGVNGTGKTTTIGKLAAREVAAGRTVVVAAADTFRAAAADQLAVWAERTGATLVRKDEGTDPASVAFEAAETARSLGADLLIVDTAGRLHTKGALMDELGKVARVLGRQAEGIDETLLVLDGTTGQNGIAQARAFLDAAEVTGIALTKLDGSARGGVVVAVTSELGLPVKLVGLGEGIDDLADFDPVAFVDGLLGPA
ncbi:MAG: signal recognition particle-docking protein FtsY [Actinomycetota bacterium]